MLLTVFVVATGAILFMMMVAMAGDMDRMD